MIFIQFLGQGKDESGGPPETRTRTLLPAADFESSSDTNSDSKSVRIAGDF